MFNLWIAFVVIILVIYIWQIQYDYVVCDKMFVNDFIEYSLPKTGDLILFKAYNNFNSIKLASYYTHIGIVYIDENNTPLLFEANGIEGMNLKSHHNINGIFLSPLKERISKYKGKCYWRRLNKNIDPQHVEAFRDFMRYALDTFAYDKKIAQAWLRKICGERCTHETNCAELVFLSWIKLGLLDIEHYDSNITHYLRHVTNKIMLDNGYKYSDVIEIIDMPFAE